MTAPARARPVDHLGIQERIEMLERALCRPLPNGERKEPRAEYLLLTELMETVNVA